MRDEHSFYGAPIPSGRRDRRLVVAVILVVVGIGLAIVKPWDDSRLAASSPEPGLVAASPSAAASAIASPAPTVSPPAPRSHPLAVAFTAPPPGSATWGTLVWRRLASDDPLSVLRAVVTEGERSVAIGDIAGATSTTVWSSTDATHWEPLESATSMSFWPNLSIIALAALQDRFVAISEMNDYLMRNLPPVIAWTSTDGRSWAPAKTLPVDPFSSPSGSPALVAAGPEGMVIATSGLGARLASSSDGARWAVAPDDAFPADLALVDLKATSTGYVAIGGWSKGGSPGQAAALWSADGRHWPKTPTLLPNAAWGPDTPAVSTAVTLTVGARGMIASGIGGATGGLWWRSPDGRQWEALETFPPLAATTCRAADCVQPNGTLVGDGHRLIAWSGGAVPTAWISTDGQRWTTLRLAGDVPDTQVMQATLLPGGVLLSDGVTTWFGQAAGG